MSFCEIFMCNYLLRDKKWSVKKRNVQIVSLKKILSRKWVLKISDFYNLFTLCIIRCSRYHYTSTVNVICPETIIEEIVVNESEGGKKRSDKWGLLHVCELIIHHAAPATPPLHYIFWFCPTYGRYSNFLHLWFSISSLCFNEIVKTRNGQCLQTGLQLRGRNFRRW